MTHTLPTPAFSAARAHSTARPGTPCPMSARPRLSVQRQSIGLAEDAQESIEIAVGGRYRWQPRAARTGILEPAGRQHDDDGLLRVERAAFGELHHRRQCCGRRWLDVEAFFARERTLCLEHALVGESHAGAR